ncbi:unnamed protein product, partial [marine sediment metagenome]
GGFLKFSVVGTADEGAGFHMSKPQGEADTVVLGENFGRNVPDDRQVHGRGLKVLTDGEAIARYFAQIAHGTNDFVACLAKTEHEAGLGFHPKGIGASQKLERAPIPCLRTDGRIETVNRLDIVIQNIRCGITDQPQSFFAASKIGNKDFYLAGRHAPANFTDRDGKDRCTAIGQVVTSDGCDNGVLQPERLDRLGDALGLAFIQGFRLPGPDRTKAARTGANIAQD